jgi:hypothetical protein
MVTLVFVHIEARGHCKLVKPKFPAFLKPWQI